MESLAAYLRTLSHDELTALLASRRDVTLDPAPRTAGQLATRLLQPSSMAIACATLNLPQLQVGEAAAALGDGCSTERLATLFGVPEDDPELTAALRRLAELALIWPYADGLAAAQLCTIWPYPLDLGLGAAELLVTWNTTELRRLARLYGVSATGLGKDELIAALAGWLARKDNVCRLVAEAPADVRARLATLAQRAVGPYDMQAIMYGPPGTSLPWASERGLVVGSIWGTETMPREVALALRDDLVAAFDTRPPAVSVHPVEQRDAEREAAAAASETLAAITAIVAAMSGGPVPLLKSGGLGVRELRRIAKASGQDEDRTRLTVELLAARGLIQATDAGLTPSPTYDEFAAAEPAAQLVDVVTTWLAMPGCPLAPADSTAVSARLLYWGEDEEMILTGLRVLILRTLAEVAPEGQVSDPAALIDRLAWQAPVVTDGAGEDLQRYVTGIWREAHRLGLIAHGGVTGFCRSLLTGGADEAHRQAESVLPRPRGSVLLQNDLTAVATGTPSADLLALLDGVAAAESRSGAWAWRFSPATIRAALDAGDTPAGLLARIAEVAEGGRVPQTLTYLIDDVARQHGRVQVRPVGCCLCSDDEILLTEILNTRSLRALRLARIAPTVLVSAKPQAETLAALRAAGHAPAALGLDGSPAIEVPPQRRAAPPLAEPDGDGTLHLSHLPYLADPADVARTLLGSI